MRIIFRTSLFCLAFLTAMACHKRGTGHTEGLADEGEWPEMDSFHMVMADAFHPFKDSANLEPVKSLAGNLAKEADAWAAASLPEKMNTDEVKAMLEKLKADAHALADDIKSGTPDTEIGKELTALHSTFHAIMEAWYGGEEKAH